jgi:peptidoglycan/LPS O-acetylase OafA/YrhL
LTDELFDPYDQKMTDARFVAATGSKRAPMSGAISSRFNNFDCIRFLAAFAVIVGHCQTLIGAPHSSILTVSCSTFGVYIFFCLSGYLIADSWESQPSAISFFAKRSLRIFPALIVVILLSACVLGPLLTRLSWPEYFANRQFWDYFNNIRLCSRYNLPGVFETNFYKYAVNGSLWSLPVEFFCYILVAAIGMGLKGFRRYTFLVVAAAAGAAALYRPYYHGPQVVIYATDAFSAAEVIPFFFVGAAIRAFRIPVRSDVALLLLLGLVAAMGNISPILFQSLMWIVIAYVTIAVGREETPVVRRWGRFGDFSYGLYLYAFPASQLIVALCSNKIEIHILISAVTLICLIFSAASWHLVERRALRLKPKGRLTLRDLIGKGAGLVGRWKKRADPCATIHDNYLSG